MCRTADQAVLDECVRDAFETFLVRPNENRNGIQIPQFDPFVLPLIRVDFSNLNLQAITGGGFEVKNLEIHGFRNSRVLRVKTNFTDDSMQSMKLLSKLAIPKLFLTGFHGQDLSKNSQPTGQFNLTLSNVIVKAFFKGHTVFINGENRNVMRITESTMKAESENLKVSISNLFPDPNLSE